MDPLPVLLYRSGSFRVVVLGLSIYVKKNLSLWKPSHVWLLIASFLRKSKTPVNHLNGSVACSSIQEWILSGGCSGVVDLRKEKLATMEAKSRMASYSKFFT